MVVDMSPSLTDMGSFPQFENVWGNGMASSSVLPLEVGGFANVNGISMASTGGGMPLKRCQGFIRCDIDIDAEVVGWVIGRSGSTIKDLKNKTGCNMWVDQRALKLTITGGDARSVEHAASCVVAYIAAAPIKAGAVESAVTRTLDCPPQLLNTLGDRGLIARIVKESRAQVVVNKKMGKVIVKGGGHAVAAACRKIQEVILAASSRQLKQQTAAMVPTPEMYNRAPEGYGFSTEETEVESYGGSSAHNTSTHASPVTSAPTSPHSARHNTWSLFSSPFAPSANGAPSGSSSAPLPSSPAFEGLTPVPEGVAAGQVAKAIYPEIEAAAKELADFLESLHLSKYTEAFLRSEVDLEALSLMDEMDFKELNVPKGPRLKIMNAVRKFNEKSSSSDTEKESEKDGAAPDDASTSSEAH